MSRTKKSRRLKGKLDIKTGSKKNFIERGQKGRIPSKNKLAKHSEKLKSAFKKHLEEQQNLPNAERKPESEDATALAAVPAPFSRAAKQAEREKPMTEQASTEQSAPTEQQAKPKSKSSVKAKPVAQAQVNDTTTAQKAMDVASRQAKPVPKKPAASDTEQPAKEKPRFDQLTGDDLWDLLDD